MKKSFSYLQITFITLLFANYVLGQNDSYWNSSSTTPTSTPGGANYTVGNFSQNNNNGNTTFISTTSPSSGYSFSLNGATTAATGSSNFALAANVGALNTATGGSAYIEVTITPSIGYKLNISNVNFGYRSTPTGPQAYSIQSIINNTASEVATGNLSNNSTWLYITNGISVSGGVDQPISIRIYGYNGTGTPATNTANWRLDDIVINITASNSLPVTFGSISAKKLGNQLKLNWTTLTEKDNSYFDIQASTDGQHFKSIGMVKSSTPNGFSSSDLQYEFTIDYNSIALLGIPAVLGLLALGFSKRNKITYTIAALFILATTIVACNKSDAVSIDKTNKLFVKIVQHSSNGDIQSSKVVQVVNN